MNTGSSVITEIAAGQGISPAQASRLLPPVRLDKPCHPSTITRWILDGAKRPDGTLIKLEAARVGSRWVTTRAALERFLQTLTTPTPGTYSTARSASERSAADADAARQLKTFGI
jgi:hypothetical protein